ncbi:flagellar brake protein [Paraburkholderia acidipaludis]|uniref:flagellar brake protein n=1 Tax=Paraburkholderia acidipaludis TaxID=660537 RepID=UPI000481584F|nr:flagellar brake protein [Paraburkholderia acidipaludis]
MILAEESITHAVLLTPESLPLGQPLAWPVVDRDGTLLLARGAVLVNDAERRFLFEHFAPQRGDLSAPEAPGTPQEEAGPRSVDAPPALREMHLTLGALMGLRSQMRGSSGPMQPCRLIGFAPNDMMFVTPPHVGGRMLELMPGENVELVAIASQAVYRFVCSIEAICQAPLEYLVLSKPGTVRRLRERKSIRVRAHIPVRYGLGENGAGYEGIALARSISSLGLSISAPWALGKVGERLRIAFTVQSGEVITPIETSAVIRNVQHEGGTNAGPDAPATLGLELDQLSATEQMAMKVYVFDRQDDVLYWTGSVR